MKLVFKQSVTLDGKLFEKGVVHDLDEKAASHWYLKKLVDAGLVSEPEIAKIVVQESVQEQQKRLAAKLEKQSQERLLKSQEEATAPDVEEPEEEEDEKKPKKKNKR